MIAIIDYGQGNLRSIAAACRAVGMEPDVTSRARDVARAEAVILPGVGHFATAMDSIYDLGLAGVIGAHAKRGKPILGICLGMQLLMSVSEEGTVSEGPTRTVPFGLRLIPGWCKRLPESKEPIPNVGWRKVVSKDPLLPPEESFYFCHSYACEPENPEDSIAVTEYGGKTICAAVRRGNVMGVQFHPEKSGPAGLEVLRQFKGMVERKERAA
jgi:glutamine amidotransferase